MRYRKLGSTGLMVSEIGVGGGGLGHVWGATSDDLIREAIDHALAEGINFFDVAPGYGNGKAEENLGEALRGRREETVIATKVFLTADDLDDVPGAIERSLAASLERLHTDHIDLFQLHNRITPEHGDARGSLQLHTVLGEGGVVETLHRLRGSDQVRFIGFTGVGDPNAIREVMRNGELDSVQAYYNLLNPTAGFQPAHGSTLWNHGQILNLAAELGMAAIGIRNLAAGALTPGYDRPIETESLMGRDLRRVESLKFLSEDGVPLSQVATRFVLQHSAISSVVPGVKNAAEVSDSIASGDLPTLDETTLQRLADLAADDFGVPEPPGSMM
ncbi:MAG TPA: aldo/keto reductase [Dehalococcoidia bacterium]|nr:aldo/keto reductase [Dehalococcoidia bacterium]